MIWTAKKDVELNSGLTETYGGLERCDSLAVVPCVGSRVFMRTSTEGEMGWDQPWELSSAEECGFSPGLQEEHVLDGRMNGWHPPS